MTDREIIIALAEKVMGWQVDPDVDSERFPYLSERLNYDAGKKEASSSGEFDVYTCYCGCKLWNPLLDPVASKQVRDKMRADGWSFEFRHYVETPYSPPHMSTLCHAMFSSHKEPFNGTNANEIEERAVSLAALRAMGVEIQ